MPATLPDAIALLGTLVQDPRLALGIQTVLLILLGSGVITAAILHGWKQR